MACLYYHKPIHPLSTWVSRIPSSFPNPFMPSCTSQNTNAIQSFFYSIQCVTCTIRTPTRFYIFVMICHCFYNYHLKISTASKQHKYNKLSQPMKLYRDCWKIYVYSTDIPINTIIKYQTSKLNIDKNHQCATIFHDILSKLTVSLSETGIFVPFDGLWLPTTRQATTYLPPFVMRKVSLALGLALLCDPNINDWCWGEATKYSTCLVSA